MRRRARRGRERDFAIGSSYLELLVLCKRNGRGGEKEEDR
jgi:hypothetical protein